MDNQNKNLSKSFPFQIDTILKLNKNLNLSIRKTDSISIIDNSFIQKSKDSISKLYNNSYRGAIELEKLLIQRNHNIVRKDSLGLHIKLNSGKWKLLKLNPSFEELDLVFENYFQDYEYFLIRTQWGEGSGNKLINAKTGRETNIIGGPIFSKNGKYVISINKSLIASYSHNGFELFKIKKDSLRKLGDYYPKQWGPYSAKWIDDNEVILRNEGFEWTQYRQIDTTFFVKLKIKNVW